MINVNYHNIPNAMGGARTLPPEYVANDLVYSPNSGIVYSHVHESGWKISAVIHEDWFHWVNKFEAYHPIFGIVRGDFEDNITATSRKGLEHFLFNHPYQEWDYADI